MLKQMTKCILIALTHTPPVYNNYMAPDKIIYYKQFAPSIGPPKECNFFRSRSSPNVSSWRIIVIRTLKTSQKDRISNLLLCYSFQHILSSHLSVGKYELINKRRKQHLSFLKCFNTSRILKASPLFSASIQIGGY